MNESEIIDLLNRQAEALNTGGDLAFTEAGAQQPQLAELFDTGARVKSALAQVTPRPAFVSELKRRLVYEAQTQRTERSQRWLILLGGLGSLVYVASVLVLGFKISFWVVSLLAILLGWKKRQPANGPAH